MSANAISSANGRARRTPEGHRAFLAELKRSMVNAAEEQNRAAAAASTELAALLARVEAGETGGKLRRISILVEEWQIDGARLAAVIRGRGYQERMRSWIGLCLFAEAELTARELAVRARRPKRKRGRKLTIR